MIDRLRVAVIGCGMIANSAHFPALNILREKGEIEVVGVADIRPEAAKETAERHNVPKWYVDPQQMLDELYPDFVAVCTPNMHHKEWTIKALKAGAHVACEKPMAISLADAKEMWQTAKECDKMLFPCQCMRWRNYMQQSKILVDSGELGDVYFSDIEFIRRIGIRCSKGNRTDIRISTISVLCLCRRIIRLSRGLTAKTAVFTAMTV